MQQGGETSRGWGKEILKSSWTRGGRSFKRSNNICKALVAARLTICFKKGLGDSDWIYIVSVYMNHNEQEGFTLLEHENRFYSIRLQSVEFKGFIALQKFIEWVTVTSACSVHTREKDGP